LQLHCSSIYDVFGAAIAQWYSAGLRAGYGMASSFWNQVMISTRLIRS